MFTITIEETANERVTLPKQWKQVKESSADDRDVYGYTPEVETVQSVTRKRYEQTVDTLDLTAVIAAVNNLPEGPLP